MECVVINQNKFKIALCEADIKKFGLDHAHRASALALAKQYWGLMAEAAKRHHSFSVAERLLVQSYPTDSGMDVFVTRLSRTADAVQKPIDKPQSSLVLAARGGIFPFGSIDEVVEAVLHTKDCECYKSSLYYSDDGTYYLFCEERTLLGVCSYLYRMGEFAKALPQMMHSYVIEHSVSLIKDNAIEVLLDAFSKDKERG